MSILSEHFSFIKHLCNPDKSLEQAASDFQNFIIKHIYDENEPYSLDECYFCIIDIFIAELYSEIIQSLQPLSKEDQKKFIEELRDRRLKIAAPDKEVRLISSIAILKLYFHDHLEKKQYIENVQKQIDIYIENFVKNETKRYCALFSTSDYIFTEDTQRDLELEISMGLELERYRDIWVLLSERRRFILIENWRYLIQERILGHIDAISAGDTLKLEPLIATMGSCFTGRKKIESVSTCESAVVSAARALAICRARKTSSLCGQLPMVTQTMISTSTQRYFKIS